MATHISQLPGNNDISVAKLASKDCSNITNCIKHTISQFLEEEEGVSVERGHEDGDISGISEEDNDLLAISHGKGQKKLPLYDMTVLVEWYNARSRQNGKLPNNMMLNRHTHITGKYVIGL